MKAINPSVELLNISHPHPLEFLELCGRVCYKSEDKITGGSAKAMIGTFFSKGHLSVIEHVSATFRVICDRGISHELVRHRLASFSQESSRYCNYGKDKFGGQVTFIKPYWVTAPKIFAPQEEGGAFKVMYHDDISKSWYEAMESAERLYLETLKNGNNPNEARAILPNSTKTEIIITANLREWIHLLTLRTSAGAHVQMQQVAFPMKGLLQAYIPELFSFVSTGTLPPTACSRVGVSIDQHVVNTMPSPAIDGPLISLFPSLKEALLMSGPPCGFE